MKKVRKARNLHASHPIMRKGGVHEKSSGGKRGAAKRTTQKMASEWRSPSSFSAAIRRVFN